MAREVVTGYCWPQSISTGEQVGLHISSAAGRPVRVEVARVGATRDIVFSASRVTADEHETPKDAASRGCGWPMALTLDVDVTWRSGYYEVVMEIDVGEKVRRDYAFFVVRPSSGARIVMALATNTWHAYNDFGGPNLYTGGTHVCMRRPMSAGYLHKPPGKGRRSRGQGHPIRRTQRMLATSRSITCRAMRGLLAGPTGSCPSSSGANARGSRSASVRTPTWKNTPKCWTTRACISPSATTSTGRRGCATLSKHSSPVAAMRRSSPGTPHFGRSASREPTTTS